MPACLPAGRIAVRQFVYPAAALVVDCWVHGHVPSAVQVAGVGRMGLALLSLRRSG